MTKAEDFVASHSNFDGCARELCLMAHCNGARLETPHLDGGETFSRAVWPDGSAASWRLPKRCCDLLLRVDVT